MIPKKKLDDALTTMGKKYLRSPYKEQWTPARPTTGYCYVVSEVVYHYFAPKGSKSYVLKTGDNSTHWFLKSPAGEVIDLTADQFDKTVPYEKAKPHAFLTKTISKRGKVLSKLLGIPSK